MQAEPVLLVKVALEPEEVAHSTGVTNPKLEALSTVT